MELMLAAHDVVSARRATILVKIVVVHAVKVHWRIYLAVVGDISWQSIATRGGLEELASVEGQFVFVARTPQTHFVPIRTNMQPQVDLLVLSSCSSRCGCR